MSIEANHRDCIRMLHCKSCTRLERGKKSSEAIMSKDRLGKAPRQLHVCLHGHEPTIPVSAARLIRVTARNSEHLFTKLVIFVQPYRAPVIRNVPK